MTKILVIEDDAIIKNTVIDILKEENFQTIDASNGIVGIKLAQEYLPDLILCDVKMPNIDGYEVIKTLKNNHLTSYIPFIFLTSKTNRSSWRKGMELGADDYLTKPFTPEELLKAIATRSQKNSAIGSHFQINRAEKVAEARSIINFDRLTNLPSRLLLQEKFEEFVKNHLLANISSFAKPKLNITVLCLKIDFNQSNCNPGADILKTVAESLQTVIFNNGIVTYLDTEIFSIILPSVDRRKDLISLINKIYQNIQNKLNLSTTLDMWVGVSFYPRYSNSLPKLIEQAKSAMKPFKTENTWRSWFKNRSYFFHPHRQKQSNFDRFVIRKNLPQALALEEFEVKYQPQVCVKSGKIIACKANLNWQHPIHGNIESKSFMPVAESTGAIASLNIWLLDSACQQLKYWQQQGFGWLKLIVGASESHFYQETFNLDLFRVIEKHHLYSSIVLEIEENILLQNPQQAQTQLNGLHNLGIEIILAGFATGYTNLKYWQEFPLDGLKLDWQQLRQIYDSNRIKQIINATITLAHYRNIKAIATGFNRDQDWQFITQQGFDLAQDASDASITAKEFTKLLELPLLR